MIKPVLPCSAAMRQGTASAVRKEQAGRRMMPIRFPACRPAGGPGGRLPQLAAVGRDVGGRRQRSGSATDDAHDRPVRHDGEERKVKSCVVHGCPRCSCCLSDGCYAATRHAPTPGRCDSARRVPGCCAAATPPATAAALTAASRCRRRARPARCWARSARRRCPCGRPGTW